MAERFIIMSSNTQLAYLAGLIDGEGSITLYLHPKHRQMLLHLAVYNTNETVIDWLKLTFGGRKYKVGCRKNTKHLQEYQWYMNGHFACDILVLVLPYLIIKQAKARIAIEAWQNRQPTPFPERLNLVPQDVIDIRKNYVEAFKNN